MKIIPRIEFKPNKTRRPYKIVSYNPDLSKEEYVPQHIRLERILRQERAQKLLESAYISYDKHPDIRAALQKVDVYFPENDDLASFQWLLHNLENEIEEKRISRQRYAEKLASFQMNDPIEYSRVVYD